MPLNLKKSKKKGKGGGKDKKLGEEDEIV